MYAPATFFPRLPTWEFRCGVNSYGFILLILSDRKKFVTAGQISVIQKICPYVGKFGIDSQAIKLDIPQAVT